MLHVPMQEVVYTGKSSANSNRSRSLTVRTLDDRVPVHGIVCRYGLPCLDSYVHMGIAREPHELACVERELLQGILPDAATVERLLPGPYRELRFLHKAITSENMLWYFREHHKSALPEMSPTSTRTILNASTCEVERLAHESRRVCLLDTWKLSPMDQERVNEHCRMIAEVRPV